MSDVNGLTVRAPLPKPKAILFDWDNTLVNTWPVIHAALEETFVAGGLQPWTLDEVKARVRKSMRDSFPEIFGENWEKYGDIYQQAYKKRQPHEIIPLIDAARTVSLVAEAPVFAGVVSNKKGPGLRIEAEHLGWHSAFSALVGANDAARDKPYADPVLLALSGTGIELGPDVWFVGDSEIDLECAQNCGMTPIFYGPEANEQHLADGTYGGFAFAAHAQHQPALQALIAQAFA